MRRCRPESRPSWRNCGPARPTGSVLVVGHRGTNRVLLALLLGWTLEASFEFKHKHDRVMEILPGGVPDLVEHRYAPAAAPAKE